jgi:predicted ATPase
MLIENLKVSGLLSFGPTGIDLPLRQLNVLIGTNGSGKSNLIEVLSLLRASVKSLPEPVKEMGGVREWLWKGKASAKRAIIDAVISNPAGKMSLRHVLAIQEHGARFEVADERIENEHPYDNYDDAYFYYRYQQGNPALQDFQDVKRPLKREQVNPEDSILSQVRDPERYPALARLQDSYNEIRLFRNWAFGPNAPLRREQSTHGRNEYLEDGGENLALVLSKIRNRVQQPLRKSLQKLYQGISDVQFEIDGGSVQLFLEEADGRVIPATRLSDGTLRYLCLLAILLHPEPPPLVMIEEPELGLHPDILPHIAELLVEASERTQVIVTTHSRMLVDALGANPESIIVCEKELGETRLERLCSEDLEGWLGRYSVGELWSKGEIGGNRW